MGFKTFAELDREKTRVQNEFTGLKTDIRLLREKFAGVTGASAPEAVYRPSGGLGGSGTSGTIVAGQGLTGGGVLPGVITINVGEGDGIDVGANEVLVDITDFIDIAAGLQDDGSNNIQINEGDGLEFSTGALRVKLSIPSGLARDSTGLYLDDAIAGSGLGISSKVLSVNTKEGVEIDADFVRVDEDYSFDWTAHHDFASTIDVVGHSAFGGQAVVGASVVMSIAERPTDTVGTIYGMVVRERANPGGGFTTNVYGVSVITALQTAQTASAGLFVGVQGKVQIDDTIAGTLSAAIGVFGEIDIEDGSAANADSVRAQTPRLDGGSLSNARGLHVTQGVVANAPTNLYGILVDDINAGNTNYAIYTNVGDVFFGDFVEARNQGTQLELSWDAIYSSTFTTGSLGTLTITADGDIVLDPTGDDVLPRGSVEVDFGDWNRMIRTLYAAEMYVQTIVAQDIMATIGGYIRVAPTTFLTEGLASGASVVLSNGGFETAGGGGADVFANWTEYDASYVFDETVIVYAGSHACRLQGSVGTSGEVRSDAITVESGKNARLQFYCRGDGSVGGYYSIWDVTNSGYIVSPTATTTGATYIVHTEDFAVPSNCTQIQIRFLGPPVGGNAYFDAAALYLYIMITEHNNLAVNDFLVMQAAPGDIPVPQIEGLQVLAGPIGSGPFEYAVARALDGTPANAWLSGSSVCNKGYAAGEGFIDIVSTQTLHSHLGPTMAGYVRTGTADWADDNAVFAAGNLESFMGYGAAEFGFAAADDLTVDPATGSNSGMTLDRANGLRMWNTDIKLYDAGSTAFTVQLLADTGILVSLDTWSETTSTFAAVFVDNATGIASLDAGDVIIGKPLHSTAANQCGIHWDNDADSGSGALYIKNDSENYVSVTGAEMNFTAGGNSGVLVIHSAPYVRVGTAGAGEANVYVIPTGVYIRDGVTTMASLVGTTLTLGQEGGGEYVVVDSGGIDFWAGGFQHGEIAAGGSLWFGGSAITERLSWDTTNGLQIHNESDEAVVKFPVSGDAQIIGTLDVTSPGVVTAGAGAVRLDVDGVTISTGPSIEDRISWESGSYEHGYISCAIVPIGGYNGPYMLVKSDPPYAGGQMDSKLRIEATGATDGPGGYTNAYIELEGYYDPVGAVDSIMYFYAGDISFNGADVNMAFGLTVGSLTIDPNPGQLRVYKANDSASVLIESYASSNVAYLGLMRDDTSGALNSGSEMGRIRFYGWDGSAAYNVGAEIRAYAESTFSTSNAQSNLRFYTVPSGSETLYERIRVTGWGQVIIGARSDYGYDSKMVDGGLHVSIDDAGAVNHFSIRHNPISHGITTYNDDEVYFSIRPIESSYGGAYLLGMKDPTSSQNYRAMLLAGYVGEAIQTTHGVGGRGAVEIWGYECGGSTIVNQSSGNANVFVVGTYINSAYQAKFIVDANGDLYAHGTSPTTFYADEYDDVGLLHGFRASTAPVGSKIRERFGQWVDYARPILEREGLVTYEADGSVFRNVTGLQELAIDAIRQLHEKMLRYEQALIGLGVDPKLLEG